MANLKGHLLEIWGKLEKEQGNLPALQRIWGYSFDAHLLYYNMNFIFIKVYSQ
ncbi:hypothetical protein [Anaerotignum sp.]|uniref:hypothetical protein n=1 Tax=Anaerotignum sp. TaxID=2039241 RepID=UPI0037354E50